MTQQNILFVSHLFSLFWDQMYQVVFLFPLHCSSQKQPSVLLNLIALCQKGRMIFVVFLILGICFLNDLSWTNNLGSSFLQRLKQYFALESTRLEGDRNYWLKGCDITKGRFPQVWVSACTSWNVAQAKKQTNRHRGVTDDC